MLSKWRQTDGGHSAVAQQTWCTHSSSSSRHLFRIDAHCPSSCSYTPLSPAGTFYLKTGETWGALSEWRDPIPRGGAQWLHPETHRCQRSGPAGPWLYRQCHGTPVSKRNSLQKRFARSVAQTPEAATEFYSTKTNSFVRKKITGHLAQGCVNLRKALSLGSWFNDILFLQAFLIFLQNMDF